MEGHATTQKDREVGVQSPKYLQPNGMEIDMITPWAIDARIISTIINITTLLDKGIRILDLNKFMWIHTKHNYDKHVERLETEKTLVKRKSGLIRQGLSLYFL